MPDIVAPQGDARCEVSVTGQHRLVETYCKDCGQVFTPPAAPSPASSPVPPEQIVKEWEPRINEMVDDLIPATPTLVEQEHPYFAHARKCKQCGPSGFCSEGARLYNAAPSPSVQEAAEAVDRWTRKAYPFGSGMTEEARLSKLMKILSCHMPASLAGDRDLISRSALLEELKNSHATCIKNAEQDKREPMRVMMEHFAEAGRQIIERIENFPAVSAAGGDEDGSKCTCDDLTEIQQALGDHYDDCPLAKASADAFLRETSVGEERK